MSDVLLGQSYYQGFDPKLQNLMQRLKWMLK